VKQKKIWVVGGSHGQYSDYTEWTICFYYDEASAKKHAELAATRGREIFQILTEDDCGCCWGKPSYWCEKHKQLKNEFDIEIEGDQNYCESNYYASPVVLGSVSTATPAALRSEPGAGKVGG
jgi:hypothetical protein